MNLFSFFQKTERKGTDSTVDSKEVAEVVAEAQEGIGEVETSLSIHPEWDVPQEQDYVFRFLSNELEPLKPNQLSLAGIDIDVEKATGNWLVKAFFRTSLSKEITLGNLNLFLLDGEGKFQAEKEFNLKELGTIPAASDRPWVFVFEPDTQLTEEPPKEGWKLVFNVQSMVPHSLDLDAAWEKKLSEKQKESLHQLVSKLPQLKPQEMNFTGFQKRFREDGSLDVGLFIRNGHSREIRLEKLPLEIIDAKGQTICQGTFNLPPLSIKANTSKPWTFTFPKENIKIAEPDFSRWTARIPKP